MRLCTGPLLSLLLGSCVAALEPAVPTATPGSGLFSSLTKIGTSLITGSGPRIDPIEQSIDDEAAGVLRLTDANIKGRIGDSESADTVWVIMVHEERVGPLSRPFHDSHANASRSHLEADKPEDGQGRQVQFARIDYNAEWRTCTRWLVFRPPYLVFASKQGRELRFLSPREIRPGGDKWYDFVTGGRWETLPVWDSEWASGRSRAWVIESYINCFDWLSPQTAKIPPVVWLLLTGGIARWTMTRLHSSTQTTTAPATPQPAAAKRVSAGKKKA